MLRRRIFSSAMASVMALSSIAVVANAEETVTQVKTKADLEKLVNETYGEDYRSDVLPQYGSISAEIVFDALEAADAIIDDAESTDADYTVAYKMVEATIARLEQKTASDLKKLMDSWTAVYEGNNILNDELGDLIYVSDKYATFVDAYNNAEGYIDSESLADITDAWITLNNAVNDLPKLNAISKADYRRALKEYEQVLTDLKDYEDWRVGTMAWWSAASNHDAFTKPANNLTGMEMSFGIVKQMFESVETKVEEMYAIIDNIEAFNGKTSREDIVDGYQAAVDAVALFKAWTPDAITKSTKSGVQALLNEYHSLMVYEFKETSANDLLAAINDQLQTVKDDKGNVTGKLLVEVEQADASIKFSDYDEDASSWLLSKGSWTGTWTWNEAWNLNGFQGNKLIGADLTIKTNNRVYVKADAAGHWTGEAADVVLSTTTPALTDAEKEAKMSWKLISANVKYDLASLIKVTAADVAAVVDADQDKLVASMNSTMDYVDTTAGGWEVEIPSDDEGYPGKHVEPVDANYAASLAKAMTIAETYLAAKDTASYDAAAASLAAIDTYDKLDANGKNSKEWALVYRYLYYALNDRYNAGTDAQYTKADVEALIEKCYDLMDLTGDAAVFHITHVAMEDARQAAVEWVRDANAYKKYKDHIAIPGGQSSDQIYNALNTVYGNLLKEYNAMKYSFGEIYDKIAEVSAQIDNGDLDATSALVKALDDTAYFLSSVSDDITLSDWSTYTENYAFTTDREFMPFNRVITHEDNNWPQSIAGIGGSVYAVSWCNGSHYNLKKAYEALLAAVEAQNVAVAKGDVDANGEAYKVADALEALKIANGLKTAVVDIEVIDHNDNAKPDVADALAILKKANGLA